jgi:hypothetical protein
MARRRGGARGEGHPVRGRHPGRPNKHADGARARALPKPLVSAAPLRRAQATPRPRSGGSGATRPRQRSSASPRQAPAPRAPRRPLRWRAARSRSRCCWRRPPRSRARSRAGRSRSCRSRQCSPASSGPSASRCGGGARARPRRRRRRPCGGPVAAGQPKRPGRRTSAWRGEPAGGASAPEPRPGAACEAVAARHAPAARAPPSPQDKPTRKWTIVGARLDRNNPMVYCFNNRFSGVRPAGRSPGRPRGRRARGGAAPGRAAPARQALRPRSPPAHLLPRPAAPPSPTRTRQCTRGNCCNWFKTKRECQEKMPYAFEERVGLPIQQLTCGKRLCDYSGYSGFGAAAGGGSGWGV